MSESNIRDRFEAHAKGEGNIDAADYLKENKRNKLYFRRLCVRASPKVLEQKWLKKYGIGYGMKYEWNKVK